MPSPHLFPGLRLEGEDLLPVEELGAALLGAPGHHHQPRVPQRPGQGSVGLQLLGLYKHELDSTLIHGGVKNGI